jgi:dCTP deaminase
MAFWSSQTLETRLKDLITSFRSDAIDCAAYTLRIGPELYVTPTAGLESPATHTKRQLGENEGFTIPAGQFAFLLTEEVIEVPVNAIAFISMKAKTKFRGLVNVSGFHVDPGWKGRLTFSVFNAGPSAIHLTRGMPLFLIWYADLDAVSKLHKTGEGPRLLQSELINNITGELNSFESLQKRMLDEDKQLSDRIHAIEKAQTRFLTTLTVIGALFVGLVGYALRPMISDWLKPAAPIVTPSPLPAAPPR